MYIHTCTHPERSAVKDHACGELIEHGYDGPLSLQSKMKGFIYPIEIIE